VRTSAVLVLPSYRKGATHIIWHCAYQICWSPTSTVKLMSVKSDSAGDISIQTPGTRLCELLDCFQCSPVPVDNRGQQQQAAR
jgi:hypothetical protein